MAITATAAAAAVVAVAKLMMDMLAVSSVVAVVAMMMDYLAATLINYESYAHSTIPITVRTHSSSLSKHP